MEVFRGSETGIPSSVGLVGLLGNPMVWYGTKKCILSKLCVAE